MQYQLRVIESNMTYIVVLLVLLLDTAIASAIKQSDKDGTQKKEDGIFMGPALYKGEMHNFDEWKTFYDRHKEKQKLKEDAAKKRREDALKAEADKRRREEELIASYAYQSYDYYDVGAPNEDSGNVAYQYQYASPQQEQQQQQSQDYGGADYGGATDSFVYYDYGGGSFTSTDYGTDSTKEEGESLKQSSNTDRKQSDNTDSKQTKTDDMKSDVIAPPVDSFDGDRRAEDYYRSQYGGDQ